MPSDGCAGREGGGARAAARAQTGAEEGGGAGAWEGRRSRGGRAGAGEGAAGVAAVVLG
jgi:hypothetical protein